MKHEPYRDNPSPAVAILVGGLATRLNSIAPNTPKALIEIEGEPFLGHQLRLLNRNGIHCVVVCTGHLGEKIQQTIQNGAQYQTNVRYSFDGPTLLGTGGAVRKALPLLSDPFFVLYGDSYLECDYQSIWKAFLDCEKPGMMTVLHNENQWDRSNVDFHEGRIFAYNKATQTDAMKYIDYGLGVFRKLAFEPYPAGMSFDLADVYQELLQRDQLAACEVFERFYEIGSSKGLEETRSYFASKRRTPQVNQ